MGYKISKYNSPLTCVLKDFGKIYLPIVNEDYDYTITKHHLWTFCETEWPTFGVDWPSQSTFDSEVAWAVFNTLLGKPSHPDQIGYNLPWAEATFNPPHWMKTTGKAAKPWLTTYGHLYSL